MAGANDSELIIAGSQYKGRVFLEETNMTGLKDKNFTLGIAMDDLRDGCGDVYITPDDNATFATMSVKFYKPALGTPRLFAHLSAASEIHFGDVSSDVTDGGIAADWANDSGNRVTWVVGSFNRNSTYAGVMWDAASVKKIGTGTWTLRNTLHNNGTFEINGGTVNLLSTADNASLAWQVDSAATLTGDGMIAGTLTVENNGTLAPSGTMKAAAAVFESGSKYTATLGDDGYAIGILEVTGANVTDVDGLPITISGTPKVTTTVLATTVGTAGTYTGVPSYSYTDGDSKTWEIVADLDAKNMILQDPTNLELTAYLVGVSGAKVQETMDEGWVTSNLLGTGKPYSTKAQAITALRGGSLAPNGIPYTWCYALGLSTTDATDKPTLASAATASGWALSAAGITVPDALKDTVKIKSEGCADPDFSGEKTYGTAAAYGESVTINASDITSSVRYFRIVFDVAE